MLPGTLARADQLQHDPQAPVVNLFASVWGIGVTTARKVCADVTCGMHINVNALVI